MRKGFSSNPFPPTILADLSIQLLAEEDARKAAEETKKLPLHKRLVTKAHDAALGAVLKIPGIRKELERSTAQWKENAPKQGEIPKPGGGFSNDR